VLALGTVLGVGIVAARWTGAAEPIAEHSGTTVSFAGSDPITGKRVSLDDYAGKPVVINVWGSWCPGCRDEARDLATFVRRHPEAQTIGIDLQDSSAGARAFYREYGWHHPSISDPNGELAARLGLQGTPSTFFLDRRHHIVARVVGATNLAGFERGLRAALKS
jgi:thiol-disulfide isomerase/thioredoxin